MKIWYFLWLLRIIGIYDGDKKEGGAWNVFLIFDSKMRGWVGNKNHMLAHCFHALKTYKISM